MNTQMQPRGWRMWMYIALGATVLFPMLLLMTGSPLFTWLTALAVLAVGGTAIASWTSRRGPDGPPA